MQKSKKVDKKCLHGENGKFCYFSYIEDGVWYCFYRDQDFRRYGCRGEMKGLLLNTFKDVGESIIVPHPETEQPQSRGEEI